jgi:thiamine-monophosphate kinase
MITDSTVREIALVDRLARTFTRSPHQLNARHESDAELLRVPGTDVVLALTTDDIAEEIETGLYRDPYLIGWMTVMVNASDLAAAGARPLGLLLSETLPSDASERFLAALQKGIRDACEWGGIPILGGDTNSGAQLHMGATAIGIVETPRPLTRRGCAPGDLLFASGPLGLGAAFALLQLMDRPDPAGEAIALSSHTLEFLPRARLREGRTLGPVASACMDTSDGVVATLDELMRVNGTGFRLDLPVEECLHPAALEVAREAGIPAWMMLAGPHGEFELLFTLHPDRVPAFERRTRAIGWSPLPLGRATSERGLSLPIDGTRRSFDTTRVRNLFGECGGDVDAYRAGLFRLHEELAAIPCAAASGPCAAASGASGRQQHVGAALISQTEGTE